MKKTIWVAAALCAMICAAEEKPVEPFGCVGGIRLGEVLDGEWSRSGTYLGVPYSTTMPRTNDFGVVFEYTVRFSGDEKDIEKNNARVDALADKFGKLYGMTAKNRPADDGRHCYCFSTGKGPSASLWASYWTYSRSTNLHYTVELAFEDYQHSGISKRNIGKEVVYKDDLDAVTRDMERTARKPIEAALNQRLSALPEISNGASLFRLPLARRAPILYLAELFCLANTMELDRDKGRFVTETDDIDQYECIYPDLADDDFPYAALPASVTESTVKGYFTPCSQRLYDVQFVGSYGTYTNNMTTAIAGLALSNVWQQVASQINIKDVSPVIDYQHVCEDLATLRFTNDVYDVTIKLSLSESITTLSFTPPGKKRVPHYAVSVDVRYLPLAARAEQELKLLNEVCQGTKVEVPSDTEIVALCRAREAKRRARQAAAHPVMINDPFPKRPRKPVTRAAAQSALIAEKQERQRDRMRESEATR